ncbi:siderophore-interacting protein [Salipiger sp. IMCC34102]|uniref:siderophore-interacting protein n=1 Tax=Salipiger sp. IMCC34102 TaxID=2510647 RepID=UPI00101D3287|nr:siderophore-interacting protein [Salipiger sp. IMCC34102]RYH04437.1 siderophore-interacting protein [Salipiger sp. IMCC34102]
MTSHDRQPFAPQTHRSETRHEGPVPQDLLDRLHAQIVEYGLPATILPGSLDLHRGEATATIRATQDTLAVKIGAPTDATLYQMRESVIFLLDQVAPRIGATLRWSGSGPARTRPPNFQLASALGTERVGANFLRVHMACENVAALCVGGMHFSLLLPPTGMAPVWPILDDRMRTVWPTGAQALHRAAYTFVSLDPDRGRFSFDIYLHDGGQTTAWAQRLVGQEVVGIMGPGSGDFPVTEDLLIAGDETALPAIRRILEEAPAGLRGRAAIEIGDPADIVPIRAPAGMTLDWIVRGGERDLSHWLAQVDRLSRETFVWIAAEQATIRKVKPHLKALGVTRAHRYICHYWTR